MQTMPIDARAEAIEQALNRIGQPISEVEAQELAELEAASVNRACSRWRQPAGRFSAAQDSSPQSE